MVIQGLDSMLALSTLLSFHLLSSSIYHFVIFNFHGDYVLCKLHCDCLKVSWNHCQPGWDNWRYFPFIIIFQFICFTCSLFVCNSRMKDDIYIYIYCLLFCTKFKRAEHITSVSSFPKCIFENSFSWNRCRVVLQFYLYYIVQMFNMITEQTLEAIWYQ